MSELGFRYFAETVGRSAWRISGHLVALDTQVTELKSFDTERGQAVC